TRNMEEYGGLIRKMPWTAFFFLIGAVSISALPPSNGFVSEWLIFQSLFLSFQIPDLLMKIMLPIGASMLALTGVLALACFSTPALGVLLAVITPVALLGAVILGGTLRKRIYKTWGCGLNLTSRMEYTAIAFVQPIKRVFSTIYQPTIKLETEFLQESRYFTKHRSFEVHIEPMFQKHLYDPVVTFTFAIADRLRVIQAGSL